MKSAEFMSKAKQLVIDYFNNLHDKTNVPSTGITEDDVFIVWFNFTLCNMKALLSTTVPDGMYYEITYDHRFDSIYFDAYKKFDHKSFKMEEKANG